MPSDAQDWRRFLIVVRERDYQLGTVVDPQLAVRAAQVGLNRLRAEKQLRRGLAHACAASDDRCNPRLLGSERITSPGIAPASVRDTGGIQFAAGARSP